MTHATSAVRLAALLLVGAPAGLQAQFGTQHQPVETPAPPPITAIDDIRYLSDDRLMGRMTGSPGADTAAAYLARRFEQVGLQPAAGGWFQSFTVAKEAPVAQSARVGGLVGRNVIGLLPGHDPNLRNETVIVGGQIKGEPPRLFRTYAEGNFIEAGEDTPFLQTGEAKYGKPIIDRVISPTTTLSDATKCILAMF